MRDICYTGAMEVILLKMGETVLKGLNRPKFEHSLLTRLRTVLTRYGVFEVSASQSAVYAVPKGMCDMDGAYAAAARVFGFSALTRAVCCEKNMDEILRTAVALPGIAGARSFKAEARRADKKFPLKSPQICAMVGEAVAGAHSVPVDVHNPAETVWVAVRDNGAYVHLNPTEGAGGLPAGTAGKAVLLLSGGIDSPVAGWRMARRGLSLLPVYYHSHPHTSEEAKEKVVALARLLAKWCGPMTLRVIRFTEIQEAIRKYCPEDLATVLTRRSMCRVACAVAERNGAGALVTGDSLGQVASQTMEALSVTEQASALPVFRPLTGMDKEEVSRTARRIETFETSILPYEDCCGLFTPRHPQTKPKLNAVLEAERLYNHAELEAATLRDVEKVDIPDC